MSEVGPVWVYAEQEEGNLAEAGLELLSKGRQLADELGTRLGAMLLGADVRDLSRPLIAQRADEVLLADDPRLRFYATLPYARIVTEMIREYAPHIVLFTSSHIGRDLAPRVASALKVGLTADCTDLRIGSYTDPETGTTHEKLLLQIRPAFGGNIIATIVSPRHRPQMATVREGVMRLAEPDPHYQGAVLPFPVHLEGEDTVVEVVERAREERTVNLKGANIIVSGGGGVGSKDNFDLVHQLAEVLGAEVGASRVAVGAGYIGREHQVGQTGTTVRPKVYIACGISGAVQHRAGMQESGKIIAINLDPNAPILGIAHYGIIGNLNDVIPKLIKAYKERS
jgi:electron transfer flavoprotein alpha subunit